MKKALLTFASFAIINGLSAQIGGVFTTKHGYIPKTKEVSNQMHMGVSLKPKKLPIYNNVSLILGVERLTFAGVNYNFFFKPEKKKHSPIIGTNLSYYRKDLRFGPVFGGLFSDKYFFQFGCEYSKRNDALFYSLNLGLIISK